MPSCGKRRRASSVAKASQRSAPATSAVKPRPAPQRAAHAGPARVSVDPRLRLIAAPARDFQGPTGWRGSEPENQAGERREGARERGRAASQREGRRDFIVIGGLGRSKSAVSHWARMAPAAAPIRGDQQALGPRRTAPCARERRDLNRPGGSRSRGRRPPASGSRVRAGDQQQRRVSVRRQRRRLARRGCDPGRIGAWRTADGASRPPGVSWSVAWKIDSEIDATEAPY